MKKLLIANRGEIAIRIARTAREMGIATVAVFAEDDAASLHIERADEAVPLRGQGAAAYLDMVQIVQGAKATGCDAVHPGYGFLSENPTFAQDCADAGLTFVGPAPATLALFGDKTAALGLASRLDIPTLPGTRGRTSLEEAQEFLASLGDGAAVMLKALAGGGGRGMRPVLTAADLPEAFTRCASEAKAAFGDGALYVEQLFPLARHVEVQIVGDGTGDVVHLWDRECSLQRQRQKLVEIAPAVGVDDDVRRALQSAAAKMSYAAGYKGLGTIEFLVNVAGGEPAFAFIEANPRLQVEHTVTEQVTGLDLVRLQLEIAGGAKLATLGLKQQADLPAPQGVAIQARVNLETMTADGQAKPTGGVLQAYEPPSGGGVRVDGFGYAGYATSVRYDSLLAKVITHAATLPEAASRMSTALRAFQLSGVSSNISFLQALMRVLENGESVHTRYVEEHVAQLVAGAATEAAANEATVREAAAQAAAAEQAAAAREAAAREAAASEAAAKASAVQEVAAREAAAQESAREAAAKRAAAVAAAAREIAATSRAANVREPAPAESPARETSVVAAPVLQRRAGARIDEVDPLAVLAHGKSGSARPLGVVASAPAPAPAGDVAGPPGTSALRAPLQGTIVSLSAQVGEAVQAGQAVAIMESMKMEHVVPAHVSGYVRAFTVGGGDTVYEDHPLAFIEAADIGEAGGAEAEALDLDHIRDDLALVNARHARTLDAARPDAVARRRKTGQRTTRENIDDLLDPGSFVEYGALTVAARRRRNTLEELIDQTPADGLVMGLGRVNGALVGEQAARCAVMAYDYTVLAGTQGAYNHHKMDRLIDLAERSQLPTVFFCEGGGGRPGDTEGGGGGGTRGFEMWGRMSAVAPTVGITSGRCFAGNASVLGCCDVIIATKGANIGMGGPAMIEGGGLGVFRPEDIGPVEVQEPNGVIDILVEDEAEAVATTKQYLSYFQGPVRDWSCADQRRLRAIIPENRLRVYDIRELIRTLADDGWVLEIRPRFGQTMVTALVRIEGRPMGLIANNPKVLGGAIDSDGSDKAARFLQICEAYDLPVLSLSDTPGMMVGPEIEKTALVRHCSRLFIIGANLTVPILSVFLRKSYGLGALAMTGGSYQKSAFAVAWPTGEFGGMGLEGSVKLGYRNELAAIADPAERRAKFDQMVAQAYEAGKALNRATSFFIDDVIDPADTRRWIVEALRSLPPPAPRTGKKLRWIDAW
ncbi:MAG TPA: carboxyl transferase domain-containing protein [Caulobacteraceae bacterium]|nr:carboxyl transferase domain-containing protein [Caulobacteraceae bacterium]